MKEIKFSLRKIKKIKLGFIRIKRKKRKKKNKTLRPYSVCYQLIVLEKSVLNGFISEIGPGKYRI